ncbi:hypothetical protein, partial [Pectobacterium aquaticum]|uniref:hypothetical protein n=1 Tax=Pectobacterium aquaticum TaxID=2204145 RepID=UPI001D01553C
SSLVSRSNLFYFLLLTLSQIISYPFFFGSYFRLALWLGRDDIIAIQVAEFSVPRHIARWQELSQCNPFPPNAIS